MSPYKRICGLTFVKVGTEATSPGTAIKARSIWYVGKDDVTIIALRVSDFEPYDENALKLGTAAVMTLRKKQ